MSNEHRYRAERLVARIEARQLAETTAEVEAESKGAVGQTALPTSMLNSKVVVMPPRAETPPTGSGHLGLADLKRAAQERQARQEANGG